MENVVFLLGAVVLSAVGSALLWLRSRKPRSTMSSVDEFQREMRALGREQTPGGSSRRRPGGRARPSGRR